MSMKPLILEEYNTRMSGRTDPQESDQLVAPDYSDSVIELYKKDVDRTLLRENLKLTVDERFRKFQNAARFARELRDAGQRARSKS
jgi:hypothetical protein